MLFKKNPLSVLTVRITTILKIGLFLFLIKPNMVVNSLLVILYHSSYVILRASQQNTTLLVKTTPISILS